MNNKVTAKTILNDCAVLAKDLGVWVVDLATCVYKKVKKSLDAAAEQKQSDKETTAPNATDNDHCLPKDETVKKRQAQTNDTDTKAVT